MGLVDSTKVGDEVNDPGLVPGRVQLEGNDFPNQEIRSSASGDISLYHQMLHPYPNITV